MNEDIEFKEKDCLTCSKGDSGAFSCKDPWRCIVSDKEGVFIVDYKLWQPVFWFEQMLRLRMEIENKKSESRIFWERRVRSIVREEGFTLKELQEHFDRHIREVPSDNWFHSCINMLALLLCARFTKFDTIFSNELDYDKLLERFDSYCVKMNKNANQNLCKNKELKCKDCTIEDCKIRE